MFRQLVLDDIKETSISYRNHGYINGLIILSKQKQNLLYIDSSS